MTLKITIVGLGQIGASIGLALASQKNKIYRTGHDHIVLVARQAEKMGAVDKIAFSLPAAVREADLVLLTLPLDQIRSTLEIIAPELKEGAVVMDTAPAKEAMINWTNELMPAGRYYVGLTPVLNPIHLHKPVTGIESADADLLRGGMIAIIAPARTPPEAVGLASDLARLVGAKAYFADPFEMDGLLASTHILPQLLAAALLNATLEQSGWSEGRKVAGRSFTEVTSPILHPTPSGALGAAALLNQKNIVRILDDVIASLNDMRAEISSGDSTALNQRLADLRRGREEWWQQRQSSQWSGEGAPTAELPTSGDMLGRMVGLGRKRGKEKW